MTPFPGEAGGEEPRNALARELADQRRHIAFLRHELERCQAELHAVYGSTSWRVTVPLRRLSVLLRRVFGRGPRSSDGAPPVAARPDLKDRHRRQAQAALDTFLAAERRIAFEPAASPDVSVILVLCNQAPLTYLALASVHAYADVSAEIIVVDNGSSDQTPRLLDRLDGTTVIANGRNLGFGRAVNQAAARARGRDILLLNNDAELTPGALRAAQIRLQSSEDVGAVCGRLVLLDGTLQEAGSILWRDGTSLGYGRGRLPQDPEYQFVRDVDYGSGAFLLVRGEAWRRLGGFDEGFTPAYYEDVDLCVRLWSDGWRVVYEPAATIRHYEFGTSETPEAALAQQHLNRARLVAKHADAMARRPVCTPENVLVARCAAPPGRRVLVIDDRVPHEYLGAGFPRSRSLIAGLVRLGCRVTLLPTLEPPPWEDWDEVYRTLPEVTEVMLGVGAGGLEAHLADRRGFYDTIVVSRPHNMATLKEIRARHADWFGHLTLVYDAEAIFAVRAERQRRVTGSVPRMVWSGSIEQEVALARVAHHVVTVNSIEADHFRRLGHPSVHVLGDSVPLRPTSNPPEQRRDLLFVGAIHGDATPNGDGLVWYAREIGPRLAERLSPSPVLTVAGLNHGRLVAALNGHGLDLVGAVPNLQPLFESARVFVAPARFAGGIPLKVLRAAAAGVPCVVSGLLAEQLDWHDGVEVLAADDADGFAERIARAYTDPALWARIRDAALDRVARDFSAETFRATLAALV